MKTSKAKAMQTQKMKAIVYRTYGSPDVLQYEEVDRPSPKENEVLIKVSATAATTADTMIRMGKPWYGRLFLGLAKPKNPITGTGFAGEIVARGKSVSSFEIGDRVFGESGLHFSAHAEYVCVADDGVIAYKPESTSYGEAASLCDGPLTSLNFLKNLADIQPGQHILINGASGSLGTAAVQLAKIFGAEVTGVCGPRNVGLVKSLGADHVIDYTTTDFTQNGKQYDIIYDTVGKLAYSACKDSLTQKGIYMSPVLRMSLLLQMIWTSLFSQKKAKFSATGMLTPSDLRPMLHDIVAYTKKGQLTMVIDRTYPLAKMAEAHRYIDTEHKRGSLVVEVVTDHPLFGITHVAKQKSMPPCI